MSVCIILSAGMAIQKPVFVPKEFVCVLACVCVSNSELVMRV